jgi:5-formyltetrahydrofolate cyclo-ligase
MDSRLQEFKAALRQEISLRVSGISAEMRKESSKGACNLLVRQKPWQQAASVLFYAPMSMELDVWPLLETALGAGKMVALPEFDIGTNQYKAAQIRDLRHEIRTGRYGIREPLPNCAPVALNQLDFILVPGVAFDLHGRRLGRGKGYYDQLLTAVNGKTCGVAFDEQIVSEIPVEPYDSDLNCILTPTRWIEL